MKKNFECSTMPTGSDDTTDLIDSFRGWKRDEKTPTIGMTAKTACLLDTQERLECNSGKRGALSTLTAASPWNCTARSVQVMVDNVMPMRLQGEVGNNP